MEPADVPKTAVITPFGLFEFLRMPFGLRNAAQTFQHFINEVLRGLHFVYAYIDDVLVASTSPEEHEHHLRLVLQWFQEHGVVVNPVKCQFGVAELDFLGYRVDKCGIRPLDERVSTLRQFPRPSTPCKLREFLGLVNFYHRFIPGCAGILYPLHILFSSRKGEDHTLSWTAEADKAFVSIKEALANASLLYHPKPDAPTSIMTDASDKAVGAVLQQCIGDGWHSIAYFSRKLKPAEIRYSAFTKSCWQCTWLLSISDTL